MARLQFFTVVVFVLALALGAQAESDSASRAQAVACVQRLRDVSSQCSDTLNAANKVAYRRLDRVFSNRGNGAFRMDAARFFHAAAGTCTAEVPVLAPCCNAAALVLSSSFQDECACRPEIQQYTDKFDAELLNYWADFLTRGCGMQGAGGAKRQGMQAGSVATAWRQCGDAKSAGFVQTVQDETFAIPDWVDRITSAGKSAVHGVVGAASSAAGAAAGVATGAAGAAAGVMGGVTGAAGGVVGGVAGAAASGAAALPLPFGRRLQGGKAAEQQAGPACAATPGTATRVAKNNMTAAFYFLCPPGQGYCEGDGKCVFGRTRPTPKGEWAVCAPLKGCKDDFKLPMGPGGCFPSTATVRLESGRAVRMADLKVGDRVLAAKPDGSLAYEDVYFFGHRDAAVDAAFVTLTLAGRRGALTLTPDHFVPVVPAAVAAAAKGGAALKAARMTYARDVKAGDVLLVARGGGSGAGALEAAAVKRVATTRARGLFNPYTLGGTVVVDGVLASSHSSFLIDGAAAALGLSRFMPAFFQAAFAPLRALYFVIGAARMQAFGDALAAGALKLEAAVLGGGALGQAATAVAAAAVGASVLLTTGRRRKHARA